MKKIIMVVLLLILSTVVISGCFENNEKDNDKETTNGNDNNDISLESRFVGEWLTTGGFSFIFNSNKSLYGKFSSIKENMGNWSIIGNEICIIANSDESECYRFEFSNNYKTFTIYFDEEGTVFNKK